MKKWIVSWLVFVFAAFGAGAAPIQVSALHPLMADLARQVGGERVQVFDLVGEGGNPHRFEPRPDDMKRMQSSALILAAGKNLEPYLGRLTAALGGVPVIEVGSPIPSLTAAEEEGHEGHAHAAGLLDPHWWHGVENMRRAARVVAMALAEKDPGSKDYFMGNAAAYGKRLEALKTWAKEELGKIPAARRKLVTAHNAFAYFAKEFGFEVIAVAGLNREQNASPRDLAETIDAVKKSGVRAVFPETNTSSKVLDAIAAETGARIATPLIADGNGTGAEAGFEAMIRHNVTSITQALTDP